MRRSLTFFLAILAVTLQAQTQRHFFPSRPAATPLHTETGVLADYGVGNDTGGFTVRWGNVSHVFILGFPLRLAGTLYRCLPMPTRVHDDGICKKWPVNVVLGKSKVRVTYWWQNDPGVGRVRVSDTIALDP